VIKSPPYLVYWEVPLKSICASVQYMQTKFTQSNVNQLRDESYSICYVNVPCYSTLQQ